MNFRSLIGGLRNRFIPPTSIDERFNSGSLYRTPVPQNDPNESSGNKSFLDVYDDMTKNAPNKLAYQQAINDGAPVIKRGKMAKLGAILAASGGALGGESLANSYGVAMDAYNKPQEVANDRYTQKVKGLGSLAGIEQDEIANRIKAMQDDKDNYYKQQDLGIRKDDSSRQGRVADAQIQNFSDDNERANWEDLVDATTGEHFQQNKKTGEIRNKIKVDKSNSEKTAEELAKENRLFRQQTSLNNADNATSRANNKDTIQGAEDRNNASIAGRAQVSRDRLSKTAASMKPGDQGKQVLVDLAEAAAGDPDLKNIDLSEYLDRDEVTGLPKVKQQGGFFSSDNDRVVQAKIQKIIANSIAKSKGGQGQGTTKSGGRYTVTEVK